MATLWLMAGYFTVLTNLLVVAVMARAAMGALIPARLAGAMTLSILMVGAVYHLILARLWQPEGAAWWADQGLHTAVPLLTFGWWLAFARNSTDWADLPAWLVWPALYLVYALLRGGQTGFWPYPFLDADVLGWPMVAANIVAMLAAFALLGAALIVLARRSV